ncbi:MAG TPA: glycoside hydrolase family 43 protein [Pelobium sp.]|nr:glycoside hydrolase family 43 protein [Pelobium sp.]
MKKYLISILLILSYAKSFSQSFKPGEVWKDTDGKAINAHGGGILYHQGTYYWYGENRGEKRTVGVSCYSSKDLYNWNNEGIVLKTVADSTSLLQTGCLIERPKVIYNLKTDKYVMWFHHELKNQGYKAALTGVAVADSPQGPFTYLKSLRPHKGIWPANFPEDKRKIDTTSVTNKPPTELKERVIAGEIVQRDFNTGQMSRDMTLFVDDDHVAYHIASSEENQTLHISKLTDDYLDFDKEYHRVLPGLANEAPAIIKHQNKYYLIASGTTGWKPNPARSYVSDTIFGKWVSLGNPVRGSEEEKATTFKSQSTYILAVRGMKNKFIYMGDRWNPDDLKDSRYIWLPLTFENGKPTIHWKSSWRLE